MNINTKMYNTYKHNSITQVIYLPFIVGNQHKQVFKNHSYKHMMALKR